MDYLHVQADNPWYNYYLNNWDVAVVLLDSGDICQRNQVIFFLIERLFVFQENTLLEDLSFKLSRRENLFSWIETKKRSYIATATRNVVLELGLDARSGYPTKRASNQSPTVSF